MNREKCYNCGSENTEFVQMATGEEETVATTEEEIGTGLLELRECMDCSAALENILTLESQRYVT